MGLLPSDEHQSSPTTAFQRHLHWLRPRARSHTRPHTLTGHTQLVLRVGFSRDEGLLATARSDRTVRLGHAAYPPSSRVEPDWDQSGGFCLGLGNARARTPSWTHASSVQIVRRFDHEAACMGIGTYR